MDNGKKDRFFAVVKNKKRLIFMNSKLKIKDLTKNKDIIVIMRFGSHLYGTNTADSDEDFKGIFIPSKSEIFLNKIPKSINYSSSNNNKKNTSDDLDFELYSIHHFLNLAYKGETIAIDMLHCNEDNLIETSSIWKFIRSNRQKFYTSNLNGFVGYCRKQAAKYGIKGSRIADAKKVYNYLYNYTVNNNRTDTMSCLWNDLPNGEHIRFVKSNKNNKEEEFYQVCGKKLQKTSKVNYCMDILKKFIDSYGHRALLAEQNKGIDWKAVSHAIRYALQIKSIFEINDIIFPLKQTELLKDIKLGKKDYIKEVIPILENLMNDIEKISANINLPKKVDCKFWDAWLIDVISETIK